MVSVPGCSIVSLTMRTPPLLFSNPCAFCLHLASWGCSHPHRPQMHRSVNADKDTGPQPNNLPLLTPTRDPWGATEPGEACARRPRAGLHRLIT